MKCLPIHWRPWRNLVNLVYLVYRFVTRLFIAKAQLQMHHKYTNKYTQIQIQIQKYKYANANTQIKIHKYKWTNTQMQIFTNLVYFVYRFVTCLFIAKASASHLRGGGLLQPHIRHNMLYIFCKYVKVKKVVDFFTLLILLHINSC